MDESRSNSDDMLDSAALMPTRSLPNFCPASFAESFSAPMLLSPYQTTIDLDLIILNNRLPGLPGHISPVIDPSSASPNPRLGYIFVSSPSLSNPADSPIGFLY